MDDGVIVIHGSLRSDARPDWCEALLGALPYAWRLELERRSTAAMCTSLAGLALALAGTELATGRSPAVGDFVVAGPGEKPRLRGGPSFSVTHAGTHVACAIGVAGEVGLDLEILPDAVNGARLLKLRRWTATEAVLKAAGLGIRHAGGVQLHDDLTVATVAARSYFLTELRFLAGAVCHLASHVADPVLRIREMAIADDATLSAVVERGLGVLPQRE